jgi:signal transduction histidine kinase
MTNRHRADARPGGELTVAISIFASPASPAPLRQHWHATALKVVTLLVAAMALGVLLGLWSGAGPAALTRTAGLVLGAALVLAAALVNLARWARGGNELWPCVVVLSTMAGLQVLSTAVGLTDGTAAAQTLWAMLATIAALGLAAGLCALLPVVGGTPPLVVGTGIGLTAAVIMLTAPLTDGANLAVRTVLALTMWLAFVLAAVIVHRHWAWDGPTRTIATVAVLCVGASESFRSLADLTVWTGTAAGSLKLLAAALLTGAAYVVVRNDLLAHRRHIHTLRHRLVAAEESGRRDDLLEQHSLRNLVAGISMAAELLEDDGLEEPTRRRFEHRIHLEAQQLCHLIDERTAAPRRLRVVPPPADTTRR